MDYNSIEYYGMHMAMPTIIMMFGCGVSGDVEVTGKSHRGLSNMSSGMYLKFQNTFAFLQKNTPSVKFSAGMSKKKTSRVQMISFKISNSSHGMFKISSGM